MLLDTEEVAPGLTKVNLRGRLDAAGARALEGPFSTLTRTQYDLLVDLSRVTFIASLGLRVLITGARALAQHGGRMGALRPDTAVEAVLISSGTDSLIPVFSDLREAIRGVCGSLPDEVSDTTATCTFALQVPRTAQGATRIGGWVDDLAATLSLASRAEYALRLCLEEAVSLIIGTGSAQDAAPGLARGTDAGPTRDGGAGSAVDDDDGTILLRLVAEPNRLCVTIQDRGIASNPLRPPVVEGELEPLGGTSFGVGLMRQYAREVTWSRLGETNRLTLIVPR